MLVPLPAGIWGAGERITTLAGMTLALSAFMTLACVHAIASYAYPEPADARLALASRR